MATSKQTKETASAPSGEHKATQTVRIFGTDHKLCDAHLKAWREFANTRGASVEVLALETSGNCAGAPSK